MITGSSLLTFLRKASKIGSDPQACLMLLGSETDDFQKTIRALFFCFMELMQTNELLSEKMVVHSVTADLSELYRCNREAIDELRVACAHLFSKNDYNFGLCFLFLYYFQRILSGLLPRKKSDYTINGETNKTISGNLRNSQEQVVILLTGSKDRTHIHDSARIVCEDLAGLMNRLLEDGAYTYAGLFQMIKNRQLQRTVVFLQGISGTGKTGFFRYFSEHEKNSRYYAGLTVQTFEEIRGSLITGKPWGGDKTLDPFFILLDNFSALTWPEQYEIRKLLNDIPEDRNVCFICAVRDVRSADSLPGGFSVIRIDMPKMNSDMVAEICSRKQSRLDPEEIYRITNGYPPLVSYCIDRCTDTIPVGIYWKIQSGLFGIRSAAESMKLKLFLFLSAGSCFEEKKLRLDHFGDEAGLFSWRSFLTKSAENGLVAESEVPGIWKIEPTVDFLSEMIRDSIQNKTNGKITYVR